MLNIVKINNLYNLKGNIGIFGGTFDPIHIGHLECAQIAADKCCLDKVLIMPANIPNFKQNQDVLPAKDRLTLIKLAISDYADQRLVPCDIELNRAGVTYTYDTMKQISKAIDHVAKLFFILGSDSILQIDKWNNWQQLVQITNFVCVERQGRELSDEKKLWLSKICDNKVRYIAHKPTEISSTEIRHMITTNSPRAQKYLTSSQLSYIKQKNLYLW